MTEANKEKRTVRIDIFDIEEDKAQQYLKDREECATAAEDVMAKYCQEVKRETLDPEEGQGVVGYFKTGEILLTVLLDPFEIPVMKMAIERGKLEEYVLAANGFTLESIQEVMKEVVS
ncbi:hypothetical protein [Veillonella intestinalis]|uniref:hypothetical protein n=1 Tax=Veillonella intestinalis TaxID=2941341 RepID=UPI00203D1D39|nr:hypothetical protein [Veillonella intestinalis]